LPYDPPVELRAQALGVLAAASLALQGLEKAADALREAFDIARELNLREKMGVLAGRQIRLLIQKGEPEAAAAFGKRFLSELEKGSDRHGLARFHRDLGCAYRELGPDWADLTEKYLNLALRAFDGMGSVFHAAVTRQELAAYWRLQGEEETADELTRQARKDLELSGAVGRAPDLNLSEKDT
jgi:tetratricopeptide (TPR) repeat protein